MAVHWNEKITRGGEEWRPFPEQIVLDAEMNGRHDLPDIQWLIESILAVGQIQPVPIRRVGGKPVLAAGFSRFRAISEINKKELWKEAGYTGPLTVRCFFKEMTEKEAFVANIHENRVRNPTSAIDDAHNLHKLIHHYEMSEQDAADVYRASVSWVKSRLALIEATPAVEKQIRAGKIKGPAAKAIAKLSKEQQNNLAKVAETNGKVTTADIQRETGAVKQPAAKAPDLLSLADAMCRLILDPNVDMSELELAAKAYKKARGL